MKLDKTVRSSDQDKHYTVFHTSNCSSVLIDVTATGSVGIFGTAVGHEYGMMTFLPGCFGVARYRHLSQSLRKGWTGTKPSYERTDVDIRYRYLYDAERLTSKDADPSGRAYGFPIV